MNTDKTEKNAAGGVDAVLDAGVRGAGVELIEAAEEPLAGDETVDQFTGLWGGRGVVIVVVAGESGVVGGVFPGEEIGFCKDSRAEVGGDNAGSAGGSGGAAGSTSIGAGGGKLAGGAHGLFTETPKDL
jgi:hypothetical protein